MRPLSQIAIADVFRLSAHVVQRQVREEPLSERVATP